MIYHVYNTDQFEEDLNVSLDYIEFSLHNPRAADNLFDEVTRSIASLAQMSKRYALVNDGLLAGWGIRAIRVKNYLAFYTVDGENKCVHVIRFLYGRSDWRSILRSEMSE